MVKQELAAPQAVHFPNERIRSLFPALQEEPRFVFFDNGAGAQVPRQVFEAIHGHLLHRNVQRGGRYNRSVEVDATLVNQTVETGSSNAFGRGVYVYDSVAGPGAGTRLVGISAPYCIDLSWGFLLYL